MANETKVKKGVEQPLANDLMVSKSNPLISSKYNLNLNSIKVLNVAFTKINPFEKLPENEGATVLIPTKEIKQALNVKGNSIYTQMRRIVDDLAENNNFYFDGAGEDGAEFGFFVLIDKVVYKEKKGVEIKFGSSVTPYLFDIQRKGVGYTTYRLANIFPMNSKYSIKLYELLKQQSFLLNKLAMKNSVEISYGFNELKILLNIYDMNDPGNKEAKNLMKAGCKDYEKIVEAIKGADKNKYQQISPFKNKVLNVAQKEIHEMTDIDFEYRIEGKYGRPKTIIFTVFRNIKTNQKIIMNKQKLQKIVEYDEKDMDRMYKVIEYISDTYDLKVSDARAVAECAGYDLHIIDEAGKLLQAANNVENRTGWLITCIKRNWAGVGTMESENAYIDDDFTEVEVNINDLP